MRLMKYGITMNCFENRIKFEYSNFFFVAQSFVGIEIESFLATFVGNRYDSVNLSGPTSAAGFDEVAMRRRRSKLRFGVSSCL